MPITSHAALKSPEYIVPSQPALNVRIRCDVARVVITDEVAPGDWPVDRDCHQGKQQADAERLAAGLMVCDGGGFNEHSAAPGG